MIVNSSITTRIDSCLEKYYDLKNSSYINEDGDTHWISWCDENGYDSEAIKEEFQQQYDEAAIVDFDDDFPTDKTGDDRIEEIFEILYASYAFPSTFLNVSYISQECRQLHMKRIEDRICKTRNISNQLVSMEQQLYEPYGPDTTLQTIPPCTKDNKMHSYFNCMLTPFRTKLLMIGFSKLYSSCHVTMDIIKLFIAYFGSHIVYSNNEHLVTNDPQNDIQFKIKLNKRQNQILDCVVSFINIVKVSIIIFRIRLYFISKKDESVITGEHIVMLTNYNRGCTLNSKITEDEFIFGVEIEVLHIRWSMNKTWSEWCYPWNDNENDKQLLFKNDWFRTHFDKHCFGVNGNYFVLPYSEIEYGNFIKNKNYFFDYLKCKLLSKFDDMMIVSNMIYFNNVWIEPVFDPLNKFIESQIIKLRKVNEELEKLDETTLGEYDNPLRRKYNELQTTVTKYRYYIE